MNYAFTILNKSIILCEDVLQIYHAGFIKTKEDYDAAEFAVTNYLFSEGFLEDRVSAIGHIHIFDYDGQQVAREHCV